MYYNKRRKTFCIVISNVLCIFINIQNTTIFEPVILTGFYTSIYIYIYINVQIIQYIFASGYENNSF